MANGFLCGSQGRPELCRPTARDRIEQFQGQHRIGERVIGIFLRWEGRGLGWVDFQGNPLLASMASRPEPGTRLFFLVKQLFPEIVLQEIIGSAQPGILNILQQFWAGQSLFETHLRGQAPRPDPPHLNYGAMSAWFRNILERDSALTREYAELSRLREAINTELGARGLGRYLPLPWLAHHVRSAGVLLIFPRNEPSSGGSLSPAEAQFVGTHPALGHMEIHFALIRKPVGFTLYLERFELAVSLKPWLDNWFARISREGLVPLGMKPLSGGLRSGILARLLLPWEPGMPGLRIQV
jgi:hypothetical protein